MECAANGTLTQLEELIEEFGADAMEYPGIVLSYTLICVVHIYSNMICRFTWSYPPVLLLL